MATRMSANLRSHIRLVLLMTLAIGLFGSTVAFAQSETPRIDSQIAELTDLVGRAKWEEAGELAGSLDVGEAIRQNDIKSKLSLIGKLARLGFQFQKHGDLETSDSIIGQAYHLWETLPDEQRRSGRISQQGNALLWTKLGIAVKTRNLRSQAVSLSEIAKGGFRLNLTQHREALLLALKTGSALLSQEKPASARSAYQAAEAFAIAVDEPEQIAMSLLGQAWSSVIDGTQPKTAAEELIRFTRQFPRHPDAPRASYVASRCLLQSGDSDAADQWVQQLVERWPKSDEAIHIAESYASETFDRIPSSIRSWVLQLDDEAVAKIQSTGIIVMSIDVLIHAGEADRADQWVKRLSAIDQSGQATSDLLSRIDKQSAERVAVTLLSPEDSMPITGGSREAVARWAGRNQQWSMLVFAAESESIDRVTSGRTIAVERLFAESLMQSGRAAEASSWWNHLADHRKVDDFATLLRCAEAETAVGEDSTLAQQRIAMARVAAAEDPFQLTLTDLLDAELAIRRSRFDEARSLLEKVVRGTEIDSGLRGRAQWLIGETHYLQQAFPDAIDAYRRVEGIDPGGAWVAASLVQAGKSFEQLGRTREAAVCYGNLLGRFADSDYADSAQDRMASLAPSSAPNSSNRTSSKIEKSNAGMPGSNESGTLLR